MVYRLRLRYALFALLLAGMGLLALASVAAAAPPDTAVYNPIVAELISGITTPTLAYELEGLTGERPVTVAGISYTIATRNVLQSEAISMATRYAYEWFAGTGLEVSYHTYTWGDYEGRNVVAEKPGLVAPDEVYLITAHLDDMPPGRRAPGADDNASGSVAVMLAARLLAERHLAYTVRFVLFTGEEYGLLGSDAYAADCAARGEDIQGVINLDMIGYNTGKPVYEIFALDGDRAVAEDSRRLAGLFVDVVSLYDLDLVSQKIVVDYYPLVGGSDQWSFLARDYPAVLVSEGFESGDFNPHYHTVDDTLSAMDLDYCADIARASLAALAHLARILPGGGAGRLSGTVTYSPTAQPVSGSTVVAFWPAYHYTFTAATDADGAYAMSLPAGEYTLTVSPASSAYSTTVATGVVIPADGAIVWDVVLRSADEPAPVPAPEEPFVLSIDFVFDLFKPARLFVLLIHHLLRLVAV
ncbi:MAG: M20/M25/M40 family metallo-hydrolase [Anaerolineae bacterium]|nr:M20/M25/M40 family metallo-hydrolase [Anaerolineae bacterium]